MSELDVEALTINFDVWRAERAPDLKLSDAFELYAIESILRDADLSDEEISSGHIGGGDDGAIDGIYLFVNRRLILDESAIPEPAETVKLWLIQAKNHNGFGELVIQKYQSFIDDLLSFSKPIDLFTVYSQRIKSMMMLFRDTYRKILGQPHEFTINFSYATKSDHGPNLKVKERVKNLEDAVKKHTSSAKVEVDFWGAAKLTNAFRSPPNRTLLLDFNKSFMADDGSVVCLARLDRFAGFLTDESGAIRQYLLDPNVRDYQGERNPVNRQIRDSLASNEVTEFWWLNNGVTILADSVAVELGHIKMVSPELVNGLQTSYEVFNHFSKHKGEDQRKILVRVILPPDSQTRRRIVKATNSQSPVDPLSLHATEDIHFDIEELFKLYGVFYDRRKGEYKRLRKPISSIVGMKVLAQALIAVVLQRPDDARARPMTILGKEDGYNSVFDISCNRDVFLFSVLLDRQVAKFLSLRNDLTKDEANDLQYYIDTWMAAMLAKHPTPSKARVADAIDAVKVPVPIEMLQRSYERVREIYGAKGGDDKAAKGVEMRAAVLEAIRNEFKTGQVGA